MRRTIALAAFVAVLIGMAIFAGPSFQARGQDDGATRISALETTVASQGHDISNLRKRVSDLESATGGGGSASSDTGDAIPTDGHLSFHGKGDGAIDPIVLSGPYRVEATCSIAGLFYAETIPLDKDNYGYVSLSGYTPYNGSEYDTFDNGKYAFSINCEGDWTLSFTPAS